MRELNIGLFGCGVVGGGLVTVIGRHTEEIARTTGLRPVIRKICIRDPERARPATVDPSLLTTDPEEILEDRRIDVVVEAIGGEEPALDIISRALLRGVDVVTANKLVVGRHLQQLHRLQDIGRSRLFYGAAVCGSLPILKIIDETLATDRIVSIRGILNGSTNFLLGALERGVSRQDALAEGRARGFLEADPTADLSGEDAAQKLAILAWHAFGVEVAPEEIPTVGVDRIDPVLKRRAAEIGGRIKLVASATFQEGELDLSVLPTLVTPDDPLYGIADEMNGVVLDCDGVGPQFYAGRGAGSIPTANAVAADLLDLIARRSYRRLSRNTLAP